MKKRLISFALCVVTMMAICGSAFAEEHQAPTPRWSYIASIGGNIEKKIFSYEVSADVFLHDYKNKANITATLQSYHSGWSDINTWTGSGTGAAGCSGSKALGVGTYRVKISVSAYSPTGSFLESTTVYTDEYSVR